MGGDMAFILTRIHVGDYAAWKPLFDQDLPGTRRSAVGRRLRANGSSPPASSTASPIERGQPSSRRPKRSAAEIAPGGRRNTRPEETIVTIAAPADAVLDFNPKVGMLI